nr:MULTISPECIES: DUF2798 domain-containing protein [Afipia]
MRKLSSGLGHFVYGMIQSGITSGVASGIASLNALEEGGFFTRWSKAWLISWIIMVPFVLLAAPLIRRLTLLVVADDAPRV